MVEGACACKRQQGEDQEHHERALLSRNPVGVDREESHHKCTTKREAAEGSGCAYAGGGRCNSRRTVRSAAHDGRTGCLYRIAPGRTDRATWEDLDFESLVLHVRRSVVAMVESALKTEASQKDVPLDSRLAESLSQWRQRSPYTAPGDWVFASPHKKGTQPYWPGTLWRYHGKPAVKRAAVNKHVSYHTFRHTFGTLLNANGENPKVVQELLRHASLKVATDVYMQAVSRQKREAQSKLVRMVLKKMGSQC